jgi:hypothetical protein
MSGQFHSICFWLNMQSTSASLQRIPSYKKSTQYYGYIALGVFNNWKSCSFKKILTLQNTKMGHRAQWQHEAKPKIMDKIFVFLDDSTVFNYNYMHSTDLITSPYIFCTSCTRLAWRREKALAPARFTPFSILHTIPLWCLFSFHFYTIFTVICQWGWEWEQILQTSTGWVLLVWLYRKPPQWSANCSSDHKTKCISVTLWYKTAESQSCALKYTDSPTMRADTYKISLVICLLHLTYLQKLLWEHKRYTYIPVSLPVRNKRNEHVKLRTFNRSTYIRWNRLYSLCSYLHFTSYFTSHANL